jgi:hypothetical protein
MVAITATRPTKKGWGWAVSVILMGKAVLEKVKGLIPQIIVLRNLHDRVAIAGSIKGNGHDLLDGSRWTVGDHHQMLPHPTRVSISGCLGHTPFIPRVTAGVYLVWLSKQSNITVAAR